MGYQISFIFKSETDYLHTIETLTETVLRKAGHRKKDKITTGAILAVVEIITNIIEHNFKFDPKYNISLVFKIRKNKTILIIITDKGKKYTPPVNYDPNGVKKSYRGMGIHLVRKVVKKYKYSYNNTKNQNEVYLTV